jgi:hypothetical protein
VSFAISRSERDWLAMLIAYRFFIADEVRVLHAREAASKEQIAREFGQEMRLLSDLGWFNPEDIAALDLPAAEQEEFEVTMLSPADLEGTLARLRDDARAFSEGYPALRPGSADHERQERRLAFQLAAQTCEEVLVRLHEGEEQSE